MDKNLFAAVDIGTNSVRMLIAKVNNNKIIPKSMMIKTTRIGEGLGNSGIISQEAIQRTIAALVEMFEHVDKNKTKIVIIATSAVRDAFNAGELIGAIEKAVGESVTIISGEQEAILSYKGVLSAVKSLDPIVVVDIGGGSTEVAFEYNGKIESFSCDVGAVRCTENTASPSDMFDVLKASLDKVKRINSFKLVAVGGTATTLAAIHKKMETYDSHKIHGSIVNINDLIKIIFDLAGKSTEERMSVPGLQPKRANIIVAGLLILWVIMTYLDIDEVIISEADILYGIILENLKA